mgnify:CR=1 FL=1
MIDNEPRSPTILDINATNSATVVKNVYESVGFSSRNSKLGKVKEIRTLIKENAKLQIVVIENESLKKMVAKLEDEIQDCTRASFETNERLNKIGLKEALKEEKMDTMRWDVSEMKNVCTTKLWVNVCGGDVVTKSSIMQVMNQEKNVESIDVQDIERA